MTEPWLKFFTSDWRADPRLRMCSPAARGMWIEMICLMHEAMPYGHLLIHGQSPNEAQLASLTGIQIAEVPDLVAELERAGVFSRTREGVIYSRKLVRMASRSAKARKNGKKGGNPSLGNKTENQQSVNLEDKGEDKTQIPYSRSQKEEREANASPKKTLRGSRLPTDWRLPKSWGDWAIAEGVPDQAARAEADRFRDYWLGVSGQKGVKLDWEATWRNWVRKWISDQPQKKPQSRQPRAIGERKTAPDGRELEWSGIDGWMEVRG